MGREPGAVFSVLAYLDSFGVVAVVEDIVGGNNWLGSVDGSDDDGDDVNWHLKAIVPNARNRKFVHPEPGYSAANK